ncbi:MAG: HAD family hydrolase [Dehalococcoidales bacterium]|nr:HAD family hydrolase [Dehalococcoidales bacterium]
MRYQAVIFDLFGTLVNTWSGKACDQVLEEVAHVLNAPVDGTKQQWFSVLNWLTSEHTDYTEKRVKILCDNLGVAPSPSQLHKATQIWLDFVLDALKPRSDTLATLHSLKANHKIGVISDCAGDIPELWPRTQFPVLFDTVVFSCVAGLKKPDPQIYALATTQLGVQPQHCLFIGDGGSHELTGATKYGMKAVKIAVPGEDAEDARAIQREDWPHTISSLSEVLAMVNSRQAAEQQPIC